MSQPDISGFHPTLPEDLRVLKQDDTFLVERGTGGFSRESPEGLYHRNCRVMASSLLMLDGKPLVVLGDSVRSELFEHRCEYTNPDGWVGGNPLPFSQGAVLVSRTKKLEPGLLHENLRVRNYSDRLVAFDLSLSNQPDFMDIFEVRNWLAPLTRVVRMERGRGGKFIWEYQGQDGEMRRVKLAVTGAAALSPDGAVLWRLEMKPGDSVRLRASYQFTCGVESARPGRHKPWLPEAEIVASNLKMDGWLSRARDDLRMLVTNTRHGPFPYAGVPWFSAMFGRDAMITAHETLWLWPELAAAVLRVLAARQCEVEDPSREAQPGKILHEARFSERTNLDHLPFRNYYGAIDSAPLFVILAAAYYKRTGDRALLRGIRANLESAVGWMEREASGPGEGLLRYLSHNRLGLTHQGWRDAEDAIFDADGRPAQGPLALLEAQAYMVWALRSWAELLRAMFGDKAGCETYFARASDLESNLRRLFWDRRTRFYYPALDGASRPARFLCSSAGHVLWAGAAKPADAAEVIARLFGPGFWSGWGVRTVAKGQPTYNPLSYHKGAVWPHDTMLAAVGAARYGDKEPALKTFGSMFEVAASDSLYRLAELFSGLTRQEGDKKPLRFATACSPQAWACAVPFGLLRALLGLEFSALERRVTLRNPTLPEGLSALELNNLSFCGGTFSVTLRRDHDTVTVTALQKPAGVVVEVMM